MKADRARWLRPVHESFSVSQPYGYDPTYPANGGHHFGVDFACPTGSPVYAVAAGIVTWASVGPETYPGVPPGNWGEYLSIHHGDGLFSGYAHLSGYAVGVGYKVKAGQLIGWSGESGLTYGPHLHFQALQNGVRVDPMPFFAD